VRRQLRCLRPSARPRPSRLRLRSPGGRPPHHRRCWSPRPNHRAPAIRSTRRRRLPATSPTHRRIRRRTNCWIRSPEARSPAARPMAKPRRNNLLQPRGAGRSRGFSRWLVASQQGQATSGPTSPRFAGAVAGTLHAIMGSDEKKPKRKRFTSSWGEAASRATPTWQASSNPPARAPGDHGLVAVHGDPEVLGGGDCDGAPPHPPDAHGRLRDRSSPRLGRTPRTKMW
jgi:hypothetical protein